MAIEAGSARSSNECLMTSTERSTRPSWTSWPVDLDGYRGVEINQIVRKPQQELLIRKATGLDMYGLVFNPR